MSRESDSATAARLETGAPWDKRPGPANTAVAAHTHPISDIVGLQAALALLLAAIPGLFDYNFDGGFS